MATRGATIATGRRPAPERLPDIFYEDPEPVEDGMLQWDSMAEISILLKRYYKGRPGVFTSGGGFIMYNRANGNDRVAPDFYIAFDVDLEFIREHLPNFWIWETGKAPDFALEVASPSTAANDLGPKRDLYARLGITEYWRFDHTGGELYGDALVGERLIDGEYVAYPRRERGDGAVIVHSDLLGLDFCWLGDGVFDVLDPATGQTIDVETRERARRLAAEANEQAAREHARASDAWARAEAERARASDARARAADARAQAEAERAQASDARAIAAEAEAERERAAAQALRAELERVRQERGD